MKGDILWNMLGSLILIGIVVAISAQDGFSDWKFIPALLISCTFLIPILWIIWDKDTRRRFFDGE